jgi:hypothetical protein
MTFTITPAEWKTLQEALVLLSEDDQDRSDALAHKMGEQASRRVPTEPRNTFHVTFKTPDAVSNACEEYAHDRVAALYPNSGQSRANNFDNVAHEAEQAAKKFVRHGEYVTIEFDIDAGTATVVAQ